MSARAPDKPPATQIRQGDPPLDPEFPFGLLALNQDLHLAILARLSIIHRTINTGAVCLIFFLRMTPTAQERATLALRGTEEHAQPQPHSTRAEPMPTKPSDLALFDHWTDSYGNRRCLLRGSNRHCPRSGRNHRRRMGRVFSGARRKPAGRLRAVLAYLQPCGRADLPGNRTAIAGSTSAYDAENWQLTFSFTPPFPSTLPPLPAR